MLIIVKWGRGGEVFIIEECRASDNGTDFSEFSNPADAQNDSCMGLCGRGICSKWIWVG